MATTKLWTREELILAFNLYLKLPFGKMDSRTPEVIHLAKIIGRTPNSIAIRLTNFAHVDPYHQQRGVKGMSGGKKQVEPIWNEFFHDKEKLLFESERILAEKQQTTVEEKFAEVLDNLKDLKGEDKLRQVKTRVNQEVFRQIIIANYNSKCAITGIDIPGLLVASHIIPWSKNESDRLNPENGICFSPLYDRAFDKGLIGINDRYQVLLSSQLKKKQKSGYYDKHFAQVEGQKLWLPQKYLPSKAFLAYHLDEVFEKGN